MENKQVTEENETREALELTYKEKMEAKRQASIDELILNINSGECDWYRTVYSPQTMDNSKQSGLFYVTRKEGVVRVRHAPRSFRPVREFDVPADDLDSLGKVVRECLRGDYMADNKIGDAVEELRDAGLSTPSVNEVLLTRIANALESIANGISVSVDSY